MVVCVPKERLQNLRTIFFIKSTIFWDIMPCSPLKAGLLLGFFFDPEDGDDVPPKSWLTFNRLHGVISQKIVLFITTAVRTSNATISFILREQDVRH
jgi:hypothetical protein